MGVAVQQVDGPIAVRIETVALGNDNTDRLGWDLWGTAAICYDEGEQQGVHFVVVGTDSAAEEVLRDLLDGAGIYTVVRTTWPAGPLTPTMGGDCQLVLVGTDEDESLAYYRCTVHSTDDKDNIVIGYDTYCEDA